jgi:hypothetical protein
MTDDFGRKAMTMVMGNRGAAFAQYAASTALITSFLVNLTIPRERQNDLFPLAKDL